MSVRIQSIQSPFDDPRVTPAAVGALIRAEAMGLLSGEITRLDESAMQGLERGMAEAGIGAALLSELSHSPNADPAALAALLERVNGALDESPAPAHEWPALQDLLGLESLAELLGISVSSARRYASRARRTPDSVADRLHFLALVVGDLAGAYNDVGVRRWFRRRRSRLDGRAPVDSLSGSWRPDDDGPRRVRDLARALGPSPAT